MTQASTSSENNRLLVVDDERDIVQSYLDFLMPEAPATAAVKSSRSASAPTATPTQEFVMLTAYSGAEAVAIVKKELTEGRRVSGGFFDMKMEGGLDGVQTIQEIWKLDPEVHCTIVTAYHDRSVKDIDQIFGAKFKDQWDYINKPFTSGEIIQKARQMVASWNRRRKLEDALIALRNAQAQLIKSERLAAIGQVSRGIGHEFGNILQTIMGKADISLITQDQEKVKANLELIMQAAEHASFIVRNLQSFAKNEAVRAKTDLAKVIKITHSLVNHNLSKSNIKLLDRMTDGISITGNAIELQQVFMNLIINAMHAMPSGGELELGCEPRSGKAVAWVRDTGTGIAPEVLPKIFEFAFTTKGDKGSGLGLSISKQIIESHGGTLTVQSTVGKGTTFTIELPLA